MDLSILQLEEWEGRWGRASGVGGQGQGFHITEKCTVANDMLPSLGKKSLQAGWLVGDGMDKVVLFVRRRLSTKLAGAMGNGVGVG